MLKTPRLVELTYHEDSAARFDAFAGRPWCVLLDSDRPRQRRGRFDIFAADPYLTLTTRGDQTEIRSGGEARITDADPFALLKEQLGGTLPGHPTLPFTGGALGYFAYDLGRRVERLPDIAIDDIALPDMAIGLYERCVVVDHQDQRAWFVSRAADEQGDAEWLHLLDLTPPPPTPVVFCPSFRVLSAVKPNLSRAQYAERFKRVKRYLRNGDCYQVNLTQRFTARAEGDPWDAYKYLRQLNPAPHSAFLSIPGGAVLSSSPERFLKVRDGVVESRPIKGTRPRSPDSILDQKMAEELRASLKDRAENVMIVDLLRNDLGKNCRIGSVHVPKLFEVESFATVHHLVSTVRGELAYGRHALDLLRGCFPGGSITGAPKLRAMEIIEELEPHRRSVYCGAIGYVGFDGNMDTNIAIRTLVCHDGYMHAWAGGGIVMDSVMEAEYQESLDKAAAMIKLFINTEAQNVV